MEEFKQALKHGAEACQRLRDSAAEANTEEGIRQGREDIAKGRTRSLREFLAEFRREHGIPNRD